MTSSSISITELASFVHRTGDINARLEEPTDPREGIQVQREYQESVLKQVREYQIEQRVQSVFRKDELELTINGRVDGFALTPVFLVEEIKTTRKSIQEFHQNQGSVHRAQACLYAALLANQHDCESCQIKVTYVNPDNFSFQSFTEEHDRTWLNTFFDRTCSEYLRFLSTFLQRVEQRNQACDNLELPFQNITHEQLNLARRVYMAIRDRENLMVEAPTGTGKTIATLYPAVKALGADLGDRVIFATARNTGQQVALETMQVLNEQSAHLRTVTVIAKERICFTPGALCVPDQCDYARGHFDRISSARDDLLKRTLINKQQIELVARSHKVCPYALVLDVADWSDVVICDYNHVFDPFATLNRLHTKHFKRLTLLIDEAHRLGERTTEMLSASITTSLLQQVVNQYPAHDVGRIAQQIIQTMEQYAEEYLGNTNEALLNSTSTSWWNLLGTYLEVFEDLSVESMRDVVFECWSAILRFTEGRDRCEASAFIYLIQRHEDTITLQMRCVDPASWLRQVVKEYRSSIRFSGTLTPDQIFTQSHGIDGVFTRIRAEPDPYRFGVFILPQISTYWKDREQTLPAIERVLNIIQSTTQSNWLVAFPSFEYLNLVRTDTLLSESIAKQHQNMSTESRNEFIDWLNEPKARIGFVVMGGIFTESVDYEKSALAGVVVIGPALPPPSLELTTISKRSELGFELAYRQPALTRVIQAAGRVVRGLDDRGVILLIDRRFTRSEYQQYFPQHWQPKNINTNQLSNALTSFWSLQP